MDLLIRGVELLELLHCQLHRARSALEPKRGGCTVMSYDGEQGLFEQGHVLLLPALGICAGVGVESQADGARSMRMLPQGQRSEEQRCPAARHGAAQPRAGIQARSAGDAVRREF